MTPNRLVTVMKGYEGDKDTGKWAVTKHVDVTYVLWVLHTKNYINLFV